MVNFRIISKIIGSLLFIEALFMSLCALMAFSFGEDDLMAFLISLLITFGSGFFFLYLGRNADNSLSRKDAYVVVTAAWVVFSFFGMFPFLIHGSITNVTDAFFESTSGFTTTGASIIDDVESSVTDDKVVMLSLDFLISNALWTEVCYCRTENSSMT